MKQTYTKSESTKKSMRFFVYAVATVVVALMATACGKKDEPAAVIATVPGVSTSCVGCFASTALVASAMGKSFDAYGVEQAQFSAQFYGESTAVSAAQTAGRMYQGQVVVGGVMRIRVAHTGQCNIPAGDYTIETLAPGQWVSEQFAGIQLRANGPVQLNLTLDRGFISTVTPARVDWAGATFPFRMYTRVYVTPLNGGNCNYYGPEFYFEQ